MRIKQFSIKIFCLTILHICAFHLNAQISIFQNDSLFLNISGSTIKLQPLYNNDIILPQHISSLRTQSSFLFPNINVKKETDNPLIHGATYMALNLKYKYKEKVRLYYDLITEHRGLSYGVLNTKNIIFYPRIYATGVDTIGLFRQSFPVNIQIGNLIDTLLQDKLLFYNVDKHGVDIDLSWRKIGLRFTYYPDQINGIGLNVDEYASISSYLQISKKLKSSIGLLFQERGNQFELNKTPFLLRHTTTLDIKKYSFYLQGILRINSNRYVHNLIPLTSNGIDKFAFVLGTSFKLKNKKLSATNYFNMRFYGKAFNIGHRNPTISYRDTTKNTFYANTIGDNLYPLNYYSNGFNQWSVSTEYQNMDVFNINFISKIRYAITNLHSLHLDLDILRIYATNQPTFTYAFYELGFAYHLNKNTYATVLITNKGMNLDVHYPTFSMYKYPYLGIKMIKKLDEHWFSK